MRTDTVVEDNEPNLMSDAALERSEIVANSLMNRERGITGANSYAKDLKFDPLKFLQSRLLEQEHVLWLDLCCGVGKALIQASQHFHAQGLEDHVTIVGVDLIPGFLPYPPEWRLLRLEAASVTQWESSQKFDLITCVHGLHYIGDKLGLLRMAASHLKTEGYLVANVDLANIQLRASCGGEQTIRKRLNECGFTYDPRCHLLTLSGVTEVAPFWRYIGADDTAGPNYTKQPVVNSLYEILNIDRLPTPRSVSKSTRGAAS